uniref:ERVV2 protein n=1 Tax=Callorhinchus milii TaxID=7868 RepID=A0A4W3IAU3_CALMI
YCILFWPIYLPPLYAVSSLAAETSAALALIGKEMSEIRLYTLQNRMALDYVLAATGGVCKVIGPKCCITIDDFSGKISNITKEINQTGWKVFMLLSRIPSWKSIVHPREPTWCPVTEGW